MSDLVASSRLAGWSSLSSAMSLFTFDTLFGAGTFTGSFNSMCVSPVAITGWQAPLQEALSVALLSLLFPLVLRPSSASAVSPRPAPAVEREGLGDPGLGAGWAWPECVSVPAAAPKATSLLKGYRMRLDGRHKSPKH